MSSFLSNVLPNPKPRIDQPKNISTTTSINPSSPSSPNPIWSQNQNQDRHIHNRSAKPNPISSSSVTSSIDPTAHSSPSVPSSSASSVSYSSASSSSSSSLSPSSPPSNNHRHNHRLINLKKPVPRKINHIPLRQQSGPKQLAKDDEAVYGPPSPNELASPASSTSTNQLQPLSSSQISPSSDELFLSEHYPPIQTRIYPFFNEKLTSPIGMGRGQPIIPHHQQNLNLPHFSLVTTWRRIARILSNSPYHLSELPDSLSYPADQVSLTSLQRALSAYELSLPNAVRDHFLAHDGQDVFSHSTSGPTGAASTGIVWGLWLMSCEEVETEWGFWRRLDNGLMPGDAFTATDFSSRNGSPHPSTHPNSRQQEEESFRDPRMSSCPSGWVREVYSHPGWLPLLSDRVGNYIGVDLNPPELETTSPSSAHSRPVRGGGQGHALPEVGQVIAFGREIDEKVVLWRGEGRDGWANWLASVADDLEDGSFAGLSGRPTRKNGHKRRESDHEMGWASCGADVGADADAEEDGLGDLGYFNDGSAYGNGTDEFQGWRLASEYRGMSVIEALCARSKKRWAEIGHYSSRVEQRDQMPVHDPSIPSRPLHDSNSSFVRGSRRSSENQLPHSSDVDSDNPPLSAPEHSNSVPPIAFVTPPSPRPSPEPAFSNAPSPSVESDPRLIPVARKDHFNPRKSTKERLRRPPPPAPMLLDLPTLDNLMLQTDGEEPEKDDESATSHAQESPNPTGFVNRLSVVTRRLSEEMSRRTNTGSTGASSSSGGGAHYSNDVIGMGSLSSSTRSSTPVCEPSGKSGSGNEEQTLTAEDTPRLLPSSSSRRVQVDKFVTAV